MYGRTVASVGVVASDLANDPRSTNGFLESGRWLPNSQADGPLKETGYYYKIKYQYLVKLMFTCIPFARNAGAK